MFVAIVAYLLFSPSARAVALLQREADLQIVAVYHESNRFLTGFAAHAALDQLQLSWPLAPGPVMRRVELVDFNRAFRESRQDLQFAAQRRDDFSQCRYLHIVLFFEL